MPRINSVGIAAGTNGDPGVGGCVHRNVERAHIATAEARLVVYLEYNVGTTRLVGCTVTSLDKYAGESARVDVILRIFHL